MQQRSTRSSTVWSSLVQVLRRPQNQNGALHHPSHVVPQQKSATIARNAFVREQEQESKASLSITRELSLILREIKVITEKIRDEEESGAITDDWKFAAMVIDRFCLIVFTVFTAGATVGVLLAAPHVIVY